MVLFNDTIYYNILYGRLGATPEDVFAAARQAAVHDQARSSSPDQRVTKQMGCLALWVTVSGAERGLNRPIPKCRITSSVASQWN